MRTQASLLTILALIPLPVLAQDSMFDGDWATGDPMFCDISGADVPNYALRIRDDIYHGMETECRMTNPVAVRDLGATLYDMDCIGEGQRWNHRALFMIDRDGQLVLVSDGMAIVYPRCEGYAQPQADRTGGTQSK